MARRVLARPSFDPNPNSQLTCGTISQQQTFAYIIELELVFRFRSRVIAQFSSSKNIHSRYLKDSQCEKTFRYVSETNWMCQEIIFVWYFPYILGKNIGTFLRQIGCAEDRSILGWCPAP